MELVRTGAMLRSALPLLLALAFCTPLFATPAAADHEYLCVADHTACVRYRDIGEGCASYGYGFRDRGITGLAHYATYSESCRETETGHRDRHTLGAGAVAAYVRYENEEGFNSDGYYERQSVTIATISPLPAAKVEHESYRDDSTQSCRNTASTGLSGGCGLVPPPRPSLPPMP